MGAHDAPVRRTAARRPDSPGGARCIPGEAVSTGYTGYNVNAMINVGVPLSASTERMAADRWLSCR